MAIMVSRVFPAAGLSQDRRAFPDRLGKHLFSRNVSPGGEFHQEPAALEAAEGLQ
jgi:hypothetical protein